MVLHSTGSADLWVWSSQARVSKADMKGRGIYDPKKSRTSKRLRGHTWEVRYGDGSSVSGVVYMDTIIIGDITVENQAVEVARELSDDFLQAGCDGLVGLGCECIQHQSIYGLTKQGIPSSEAKSGQA
jgi:aspergillopepsin I